MDNFNAILAENIQKFRKGKELTQEELADKLGVTYQAVSKWENAKSAPDIFFLPQLADVFECSIDDLFYHNFNESTEEKHDKETIEQDLLVQAIKIAEMNGRISTSILQRKLRICYAQAVLIINEMEKRRIVESAEGISRAKYIHTTVN